MTQSPSHDPQRALAGARGPYQDPGRPTAPGLVTASMGRRLGARLLDVLVLLLPVLVVAGLLAAWAALSRDAAGEPASAPLVLLVLVVYVVLPLAVIAYEVVLTASGGTFGKRWLGMRVVRRESGAPPGYGSSALRYLIQFVAGLVPLVGTVLVYLSPFFDASGLRQGWHDKAAGTRVVDVRPEVGGRGATA